MTPDNQDQIQQLIAQLAEKDERIADLECEIKEGWMESNEAGGKIIQDLGAQLASARDALAKIQWQAELGFWEEGGCSECGAHGPQHKEPHLPDCVVGQALATPSPAADALLQDRALYMDLAHRAYLYVLNKLDPAEQKQLGSDLCQYASNGGLKRTKHK